MKKLLNFLLVRRTETENKWWHRLFSVLLFGSALVVLVFAVLLNVDSSDHTWVTYKPVAFSLEQNYQQANGKELPCNWSFDTTRAANEPIKSVIECKDVEIPLTDARTYGALYDTARKNLETQYGLDKYSTANCPKSTGETKLSPEQISCIRKVFADEEADPAYPQYQEALKNLAHIKVMRDTNFGLMLTDIGLWVVVPILAAILWIIFWSAVVYRSILYIIFGKKK
jgi:hypothetical protein